MNLATEAEMITVEENHCSHRLAVLLTLVNGHLMIGHTAVSSCPRGNYGSVCAALLIRDARWSKSKIGVIDIVMIHRIGHAVLAKIKRGISRLVHQAGQG